MQGQLGQSLGRVDAARVFLLHLPESAVGAVIVLEPHDKEIIHEPAEKARQGFQYLPEERLHFAGPFLTDPGTHQGHQLRNFEDQRIHEVHQHPMKRQTPSGKGADEGTDDHDINRHVFGLEIRGNAMGFLVKKADSARQAQTDTDPQTYALSQQSDVFFQWKPLENFHANDRSSSTSSSFTLKPLGR